MAVGGGEVGVGVSGMSVAVGMGVGVSVGSATTTALVAAGWFVSTSHSCSLATCPSGVGVKVGRGVRVGVGSGCSCEPKLQALITNSSNKLTTKTCHFLVRMCINIPLCGLQLEISALEPEAPECGDEVGL